MRPINYLVVHCSATPNGQPFFAKDIDRWHKEKGWKGIGYHYVIDIDGKLERGRPLDSVGAHVEGHNADSIGICLIGTDSFSDEQMETLEELLISLRIKFTKAEILGHRDFPNVHKLCPGFDVRSWWKGETKC